LVLHWSIIFFTGICCFTQVLGLSTSSTTGYCPHVFLDATTQEHFRLPTKTFLLCVHFFGLPNNLIVGSAHVVHSKLNCPLLISKQPCVS